jgi:hypothetical protein
VPQHNDEPISSLESTVEPSGFPKADRGAAQTGKTLFALWRFAIKPFKKEPWEFILKRGRGKHGKKKPQDPLPEAERDEGVRARWTRRLKATTLWLFRLFLLQQLLDFYRASRLAFRKVYLRSWWESDTRSKKMGAEYTRTRKRRKIPKPVVVFFLRKGVFLIFALPVICMVVNLGFHASLIFGSLSLLKSHHALRSMAFAVELLELVCLRYVIHLAGHSQEFHWATNDVIREFRKEAYAETSSPQHPSRTSTGGKRSTAHKGPSNPRENLPPASSAEPA